MPATACDIADDECPPLLRRGACAGGRLVTDPAYLPLLRSNGITNAAALFNAQGDPLDKPRLSRWRQRRRLRLCGESGAWESFYLKRFVNPPCTAQWRRILGGHAGRSTAAVEWLWLTRLRAAGIACPAFVALAQSMRGPFERHSAILIAQVPGASLESWVQDRTRRGSRHVLLALAEFVRRFHRAGFVHRDLYLAHIFYDASSAATPFHLIDVQRLMRPRWRRRRWLVKDLAALNYSAPAAAASATDRLRWLRTYLGIRRLDSAGRRLARAIIAKTRRIATYDRTAQRTQDGGAARR